MIRAISPYDRARASGEDALRSALLDVAGRLLVEEGPAALTTRRVAAAAGCSTTVLYRLFGAKRGLIDALYREGYERLRRRLEAAVASEPAADPIALAAELAGAYRAHALAEPAYYAVMFGLIVPGFTPSPESLAIADASLAVLIEAVQSAMNAGILVQGDANAVAEVLWAAAHGAVSLELAGHLAPEVAEQRYRTLTRAAMRAFLADTAEEP